MTGPPDPAPWPPLWDPDTGQRGGRRGGDGRRRLVILAIWLGIAGGAAAAAELAYLLARAVAG